MPDDYLPHLDDATTLTRIGEIVRAATRRVVRADGATFVLRDGDLCFYADEDAIGPLWKGQRFAMSECISGWAMRHNEAVAIPDIEQDSRIPLAAYRPTFVRSLIMVPIDRTAPIGAIGAYWSRTGGPGSDSISGLQDLADATAAAIDRVGLQDAPWAPNFSLRAATPGTGLPVA